MCEIQEGMEKEVCAPKNHCGGYPQSPPGSVGTGSVGKIYAAQDGEAFQEGVLNFIGGGFHVSWTPPTTKGATSGPQRGPLQIVGPAGTYPNINDIYLANYKEHVKSTYYTQRMESFLGADKLTTVGNVSEVQVTLNNVSSNDPIFSAKDPITGEQIVITKVYIHGIGFLTLEQYHEFVKSFSDQGNGDPVKHTVSITFGNINFGPLAAYLNAQSGLSSLSCSLGSDGVNASASWTNRESKKPSQDLFTSEIVPQIVAQGNLF